MYRAKFKGPTSLTCWRK